MRTLVGGVVLIVALPWLARADEWSLDDISAAYRRKYEQVRTIRVEITRAFEPLVSEEELFQHFRILPSFPVETTVISHRDGRMYHETTDPWSVMSGPFHKSLGSEYPQARGNSDELFRVPYRRIRELADAEWNKRPRPSPHVLVYDGQRLWEYRPEERLTTEKVERQAFAVVEPKQLDSRYFPETILDVLLFGFEIPGLASEAEYRAGNRLPELFSKRTFRLSGTPETVDGTQCVVAEATEQQRLFLDPQLAFAVRKRQWVRDGQIIYEYVGQDFEQLGDALWLPRTAAYTQYGFKEIADGKYFGKAVHRQNLRVRRMDLNAPEHLAYFSVRVTPGAWVIDQTLPALDRAGRDVPSPKAEGNTIPSVSYIQPADREDLEAVIRHAQYAEAVQRASVDQRARYRTILIWFSVGIATVFLLTAGARRLTARRRTVH